jgi:hypothetical protein
MKRRHLLKALPVAGGTFLAGCSSVLDSGGTVLGRIEIINSSFVANRIRVLVTRDDETLVDQKIRLPAIDAETGTPGTVIEPSWSDTQGQYTIIAIHYDESGDRETEGREYTITGDDYNRYYADSHEDPGCIGAVVKIGSLSETENAAIGISPTYMDFPCGTSR